MTLQSSISAIYLSSNPIDLTTSNDSESWCKNAMFCLSYEDINVKEEKTYNFTLGLCMDYLYIIIIRPSSDDSNEEQTLKINIIPSDSTPYYD